MLRPVYRYVQNLALAFHDVECSNVFRHTKIMSKFVVTDAARLFLRLMSGRLFSDFVSCQGRQNYRRIQHYCHQSADWLDWDLTPDSAIVLVHKVLKPMVAAACEKLCRRGLILFSELNRKAVSPAYARSEKICPPTSKCGLEVAFD